MPAPQLPDPAQPADEYGEEQHDPREPLVHETGQTEEDAAAYWTQRRRDAASPRHLTDPDRQALQAGEPGATEDEPPRGSSN